MTLEEMLMQDVDATAMKMATGMSGIPGAVLQAAWDGGSRVNQEKMTKEDLTPMSRLVVWSAPGV